jgi:hypothetical protein
MADLFDPPAPPTPDHRTPDYATSIAAAHRVRQASVALRPRILLLLEDAGEAGLTDLELERHPAFDKYGASTVRKRRSELLALGLVRAAGKRDGATVWRKTRAG